MVKVGLKVMFVVCDGQSVPGSENATSAGVGCKVHLDMTPKDSNNKPTEARGEPIWHYSDRSLVTVKEDTFTPVLVVKAAGRLGIVGEIDGVKSTELRLTFHPR
ncbi:MAG: hypothetical protein HY317_00485 [Acidobacteria bacterium]|nr:hypothetical protein [Acidobacteriota bacterium]